jgi:hypothetical protein
MICRPSGHHQLSRVFLEKAELWANALQADRDDTLVRDLIYDEAERAPESNRKAFLKVATATTLPLSKATDQYLEARSPENPFGNKPLSKTSANEVVTAVNYLCAFMDKASDAVFLDEITPELVSNFQHEFLPAQLSKKTGRTLTPGTVEKAITMLRGLWRWALARKKVNQTGFTGEVGVGHSAAILAVRSAL